MRSIYCRSFTMTKVIFLILLGMTKCEKYILSENIVTLLCLIVLDVTSTVYLNCIPAQQCLSTSLQYQCTVTDYNILNWRIRDGNMTSLGTEDYTAGGDLVTTPAPFPNSLPFFTDYTLPNLPVYKYPTYHSLYSPVSMDTLYTAKMEMGIWRIVLLMLLTVSLPL